MNAIQGFILGVFTVVVVEGVFLAGALWAKKAMAERPAKKVDAPRL
jgi:hypothetical protein